MYPQVLALEALALATSTNDALTTRRAASRRICSHPSPAADGRRSGRRDEQLGPLGVEVSSLVDLRVGGPGGQARGGQRSAQRERILGAERGIEPRLLGVVI